MAIKNKSSRRRRGNGEGTIYKRGSKWCAQIYLNKKRRSVTLETRKEAQEWLHMMRNKMLQGIQHNSEMIFGEISNRWLQSKELSVSGKTYLQYKGTLHLHIMPILGNMPLEDITSSELDDTLIIINGNVLLKRKIKDPLVTRTAYSAYQILNMIFGYIIKHNMILVNPMLSVERPRYKTDLSIRALTKIEILRLTTAGKKFNFDAICALTATTGLREGEVLGLRWQDVEFENSIIYVRQQAQYLPGQGIRMTELKTILSRRRIPIGKNIIRKLHEHKLYVEQMKAFAGSRWQEHGLVFPSSVGTPFSVSNFLRKFAKVLQFAGLPHMRFHDLRHTAASLMLQEGIHIKVVSERLGHSGIRITLQLYSHLMPTMQQEAANQLDLIFD